MANDDRTKIIPRRTPESAAMLANVKRAMPITAALNRLTFNDADEVRALFSELIGKKVDDSFVLIPPFYTTGGVDISVGRNVFVNQNCTFYDLGGLDIADDVMIGPNVSIVTSGHPIEPSQRRASVIPIWCSRRPRIGRRVRTVQARPQPRRTKPHVQPASIKSVI
jgi:acetyltransferase-like isoleucine patch superfamily enzyme